MRNVIISLRMLFIMTLLTGIIYPLSMTFIGQTVFYKKANGSMITIEKKITGSELIGQKFTSAKYFWGRPSSVDYGTIPSGASNLAVTSKTLFDNVENQKKLYEYANNIPADLLFASGSGVDPHISLESAFFQADRVAKARNFTREQTDKLIKLIYKHIEDRDFFVLGEKRVNVLLLNIALDEMEK